MIEQAHVLASMCLVNRIRANFAAEPVLSWVRDGVTPEALQEAIKAARGATKAAEITPYILKGAAPAPPALPAPSAVPPAQPIAAVETKHLQIDRDIPIPMKRAGRQLSAHAILADQMQVGDSILCETRGQFDTVRKRMWLNGKKSRSIRVDGKWRIWRVE